MNIGNFSINNLFSSSTSWQKKVGVILGAIALFQLTLMGSIVISDFLIGKKTTTNGAHTESQTANQSNIIIAPIETVGEENTDGMGLQEGSWSGEIVSSTDVSVYAPREGIIAQMNVNIGKQVYKGQVIGTLAMQTSFERSVSLAEKKAELDNAQNKSVTTSTYIEQAKKKLEEKKASAANARTASHRAADQEGNETLRNQQKAEADSEYTSTISEADMEIASLNRELEEAKGEIRTSQAAYTAVQNGSDNNIYALQSGVVSGIFKNVGDYVSGETQIAAISNKQATQQDRYIRFKIPNSANLPSVNEKVKVTRPGFPFVTQEALITGVGTASDASGSYMAEAQFTNVVDWPVHASIRVIPQNAQVNGIYVPIAALWWNDSGTSNIWILDKDGKASSKQIQTGRAIGDRVEVTSGLSNGTRYVAQVNSDIKANVIVQERKAISNEIAETQTTSEGGDGHDHEH